MFISRPLSACNTLKGSTEEEGLVLCPWEGVELRVWSPKWLQKVLRWLRLVFKRNWDGSSSWDCKCWKKIVNWPRETMGCLNLFLNKFWVYAAMGQSLTK